MKIRNSVDNDLLFCNYIGKTVQQLTENPEVQEKMKEKIEELKESEISKKSKAAYDTVVNDEKTKEVSCVFLLLIYSLWKKERKLWVIFFKLKKLRK